MKTFSGWNLRQMNQTLFDSANKDGSATFREESKEGEQRKRACSWHACHSLWFDMLSQPWFAASPRRAQLKDSRRLRKTYTLITLAKFHENFSSGWQHLPSIINQCCHHREDPGDMIHLTSEVTYFWLGHRYHRRAQICVCGFGEEQFKSTHDYLILKAAGGERGKKKKKRKKTGRIKCVNWIKGDWEIKKKGNKRGFKKDMALLPALKGSADTVRLLFHSILSGWFTF